MVPVLVRAHAIATGMKLAAFGFAYKKLPGAVQAAIVLRQMALE